MVKGAPLPESEKERLAALRELGILDTPVEPEFDRLTALAAQLCDAPIALISLVDAQRQWFKSAYGLDFRETHRDIAFCSHAILDGKPLVVEDATADPRFEDNPLVTGGLHVRSYAGAPMITGDGHRLGTLCVIHDTVTRLDAAQLGGLEMLAAQAAAQIETRHRLVAAESARMTLEDKTADLMFARDTLQRQAGQLIHIAEERDILNRRNDQYQRFIEALFTTMPIPIFARDTNGTVTHANPAYASLFDVPGGIIGKHLRDILPDDYARATLERDHALFESGRDTDVHEKRLDYRNGRQARDIVVHLAALKTEDGAVEGVVGAIIDVTEERALRAHLEDLAATDPLTGACNRRAFTERALAEIERCKRLEHPLSMILFDLDLFKTINDTHGHQAGDAALKAITRLFQQSLRRPTDFLGRMGGEEFAIMAVDCGLDDAMTLADRLRRRLEQSPVPWGGNRLPLTASFGVTQVTGSGQAGLDLAMRQADKALYAAKETGRNRVFMWSHADDCPVMVAA